MHCPPILLHLYIKNSVRRITNHARIHFGWIHAQSSCRQEFELIEIEFKVILNGMRFVKTIRRLRVRLNILNRNFFLLFFYNSSYFRASFGTLGLVSSFRLQTWKSSTHSIFRKPEDPRKNHCCLCAKISTPVDLSRIDCLQLSSPTSSD